MNILTLTNCPLDPTLGSGQTVLRFSEGLREAGHQVDLLAPADYELLARASKARQWRQAIGAALAVRKRTRERSYELIECYGGEFWLAARAAAATPRPLVIAHTNGLELLHAERERAYESGGTAPPKRRVSRLAFASTVQAFFRDADYFVSLAESDRRWVVEHGYFEERQTAVVPPGLDEAFLSVGDEPQSRQERVAFTGSWTPRKGVHTLVAAMAEVFERLPQVHLDIIGANAPAPLVAGAFPEAARHRVAVHGRLTATEIRTTLQRAKVFLFPSEYEGYGMALAEAMACGTAVVATPTGLGADLVHERDALICGFGDAAAAAHATIRLLQDDGLRTRVARKGRRRVSSLSWRTSRRQLAELYAGWSSARTSDAARR